MTNKSVVKGTVTDVSLHPEHGRAKVTLTIECTDGKTFTESYDMAFNMARAQRFSHTFGVTPDESEGVDVNVYVGDNYNPRHTIKSEPPLKTIGGRVLVPADVTLPVDT